ncbi:hypothetical protein D9758_011238 [Tetrapyrgos nigripes]|uniref:Nephrocystin 3-like N-terminal domain-containing protein n=1 Tax=Tetrapyrgos nigripes TaxID=182062 RepID=A0A8H5D965_9AGAR|nr:hypothetical protein D9758_011238 [Tetrapyrgos nigripes]
MEKKQAQEMTDTHTRNMEVSAQRSQAIPNAIIAQPEPRAGVDPIATAQNHMNPIRSNPILRPGLADVSILGQARNFSVDHTQINAVGGDQHNTQNYFGEQDILNKLDYTRAAFHDVGKRSTCTEGTRAEILQNIMNWAEDTSPDTPAGYWMCGMAGTGKSTIAKSMCLMLEKKGLLAGAFFCSRQIKECKDYHKVIPTITYQLARYSASYAIATREVLNIDPDIAFKEPNSQISKLLINSWKSATSSYTPVVVIDALDECENISLVLKHFIPAIRNQEIPGLKLFLTSRPEQHIQDHFNVDTMQQERQTLQHFYLHNVQKSIVRDDISIFFQEGLSEMSISKGKMDMLVESSGVLFIYAATIVKYLTGGRQRAQSRLKNVLNLKRTPDKHQTEILDELYSQILNEALSLSKLSSEEQEQSLKVLHTSIITGQPVSCQILSELLDLDLEDVQATIMDLQSVLYINQSDQAVYTFHASFVDYMTSEARAKKSAL